MRVLVTGASRGLGLELVRQALDQGHDVEAVIRGDGAALDALDGRLSVLRVDLTDAGAEHTIRRWRSEHPLDVLLNNAGLYDPAARPFTEHGQTLAEVTVEDALALYHLNVVAPMVVARACLPRLGPTGRIVNITSLVSSLAMARGGSHYLYGPSKAALNWVTVAMAHDLAPVTVFAVTPGWVRTRTGGTHAPRDVTAAAADVLALALDDGPDRSGLLLDEHGDPLP